MRVHLLFFLLCASTFSVAQQTSPSTLQTGTIQGTVVDADGGTVPNATVILQGSSTVDRRTIVTGTNGFFKFDQIPAGTPHQILVSAPGLKNWASTQIVLRPGQFFLLSAIQLAVAPVQTTVSAVTEEEVATEQVKIAEQQRIIGFIPNFYVVYDKQFVPLTPKLKFKLALRALVDPVTFAGFGLNAAFYQAGHYPSYDQDLEGFGQRLGATFAGGYTNVMVGDAILPSLLHQDPRYFFQGTGTTKSRLWHAVSSPFVTKGDDGHREINFSNIGGDLASGAIANAYYPDKDRGVHLVIKSTLIGAGGRAANAVFQEFLLHKFTSKSPYKKK
jgi:hypothetical protein